MKIILFKLNILRDQTGVLLLKLAYFQVSVSLCDQGERERVKRSPEFLLNKRNSLRPVFCRQVLIDKDKKQIETDASRDIEIRMFLSDRANSSHLALDLPSTFSRDVFQPNSALFYFIFWLHTKNAYKNAKDESKTTTNPFSTSVSD